LNTNQSNLPQNKCALDDDQMEKIDKEFPFLGFSIARKLQDDDFKKKFMKIVNNNFNSDHHIYHNSVQPIEIDECKYILKILIPTEGNLEPKVGNKIREALIEEISQKVIHNKTHFDNILNELQFLEFLVVPVGVEHYVLSKEVENADTLRVISHPYHLALNSGSFLNAVFADSPTLEQDRSLAQDLLVNALKPDNLMKRIEAASKLVKIITFLHKYQIAHGDLHARNVLVVKDRPDGLYLIDFDKSKIQNLKVQGEDL
jgi:hypothetical protein